ncbi:Conserved hypothetical protein [Candidatus Protochlamydia naegleriophila]|uniref:Uncharacterized protein n=1 Tax=Candidatus Protochlamydia naegleriophila TaxID=389348 RepID=A0A0U5JGG5_9BACT|nr:hypothetical protein [Candidatus Protochlamydia naegleriophila]CUI17698.1 Conserved hypothetical protein [Candidatus Protochlamydia naegleriophila]
MTHSVNTLLPDSQVMPNPHTFILQDLLPEKSLFEGKTYQFNSTMEVNLAKASCDLSNAFYSRIKLDPSALQQQKTFLPSVKAIQTVPVTFVPPSNQAPSNDTSEKESSAELDKRFHAELNEWKTKFKHILLDCKAESEKHKFLFEFSKNIHLFAEEFQSVCKGLLSSNESTLIWEYLDAAHEGVKFFKPLDNAALNAAKWFMIHQAKKELDQIYLQRPKTTNVKIAIERQKCFDQCFKELEEAREKAQRDCTNQLAKLAAHQIIPHFLSDTLGLLPKATKKCCKLAADIQKNICSLSEFWKAFHLQKNWTQQLQPKLTVDLQYNQEFQQERKNELQAFMNSLSECQNMDEVRRILKRFRIECELPKEMQGWQALLESEKFKAFLESSYQAYTGKVIAASPEDIHALLQKRQRSFDLCVHIALGKLDPLFASCTSLSFEEIQAKLKQNHMDLSLIEGAPRNKVEWDDQIADNDGVLRIYLCSQWVNYQQAASQLVEQGTRASLLTKIQTEKKLLAFRGIEQVVGAVLIGLKIALYLPGICMYLERYCLNYFVSNLPLPGLGLLAILSADRDVTIDALFTAALAYCIGAYYKPNEYNLEGYKIHFRIEWSKFKAQLVSYHHRVKQLLLMIQINLIENCVLGIKNDSQDVDRRFQELRDALSVYILNNKAYQAQLDKQLDDLKLKDINLLIQPQSIPGPNGEEDYSPLKQLIAALEEIDSDCISEGTKNFFEEHLGINLEQDQEKLKSKVEKFFIQSESKFFRSFKQNHANFIQN